MKLLITEPAGHVGRRVVRELLAPEFEVRVLTDDPARLPAELLAEARVFVGAADDDGLLREALEGVEAFFLNMPSPGRNETDIAGHCEQFARAVAKAVRAANTPRVVNISSLGVEVPDAGGFVAGLRRVESLLSETGAAVRHLRCGWLMENFVRHAGTIIEHGAFALPVAGNVPLPLVAARDVADVALRGLVRRDWTGARAVEVRGPAAISMNHAAEVFEDVVGRTVRHRETSANAFVRALAAAGFSREHARGVVDQFAALGRVAEPSPALEQFRAGTTLAGWVESELLPATATTAASPTATCACPMSG